MNTIFLKFQTIIQILICILIFLPVLGFNASKNNHPLPKEKIIYYQNDKILIGKWITDEKDVIEFYQKDNFFEGKVISLGNKEALKKNPEIIGAVIFKKLELVNGEFINGSYYDLESKNSYKVSIKIISQKLIKLKFGSGLFSQTSEFKKVL